MSTVWISLLKFALTVAVTAVGQVKPDQWAKVGTVITAWLQSLQGKLPAGHPAFGAFSAYRAHPSMVKPPATPRAGADVWDA